MEISNSWRRRSLFAQPIGLLAWLTISFLILNNECQIITQVSCGASRKFLTGFLVALLMAHQQHPAYVQPSYSPSYSPSYPSAPQIFVIPTHSGY